MLIFSFAGFKQTTGTEVFDETKSPILRNIPGTAIDKFIGFNKNITVEGLPGFFKKKLPVFSHVYFQFFGFVISEISEY